MPTFKSYSAWIEVDGERLPEYGITEDVQPDGSSKVSCWIPSVVGKTFRIGYGEEKRLTSTEVAFKIDGHRCSTTEILLSKDRLPKASLKRLYRHGAEGRRGLLPFAFGNCRLTDDESVPRLVEGLGEIQVDFYDTWITNSYTKKVTVEFDDGQSAALSRYHRIHEKAKKALVHRVELKEKPIAPAGRIVNYLRTRMGAKRVQFLFKYRPIDVLRAADIVPNPLGALAAALANTQRELAKKPPVFIDLTLPPPSPKPAEVIDLTLENDDDGDSDENQPEALVKRLQDELATAKQRMEQNKRKRDDSESGEGVSRRVKQEPIASEIA